MTSLSKRSYTAVCLVAACIFQITGCGEDPQQTTHLEPCRPFPGPLKTLSKPLSVEQVEASSLAKLKQAPYAPQVPFGYSNEQWIALKAKIRLGDTLHEFETDITGGHTLMRNGCHVDRIVSWVR